MKTFVSKHWFVILLLALVLAPVGVASAQGPGSGDKVIFGGSFSLPSGETLDGDLVVFGGAVDVAAGATVAGDVAVIGGSVDLNGAVQGDVSVIGGSLDLGATAVVDGNAVSFGGSFNRHPDAIVRGDAIDGLHLPPELEDGITLPEISPDETPSIVVETGPRTLGDWLVFVLLRMLAALGWATLLGVLAAVALALLPRQAERVADTLRGNAVTAFVVGFVTLLLAAPLLFLLIITLCLAPLALVLGILLLAALLFGWIAAGWLLGKRLFLAFKLGNTTPILEAVVGVVLLTLLWRLPLVAPCLGDVVHWLIGVTASSLGLGAVILSRFGSQRTTGTALLPPQAAPSQSLTLPPEV